MRSRVRALFLGSSLLCLQTLFPVVWADGNSEVFITINDDTGKPVAAVEVVLTPIDTADRTLAGHAPQKAKTSKKGRAAFPFLPYNNQGEGRYAVTVVREGYFIREYKIVSRQPQGEKDYIGVLIQDEQGKASPKQKVPALKAKPGGKVEATFVLAPVGAAAASPQGDGAATGAEHEGEPAAGPSGQAPASAPANPIAGARALMTQGKYAEAEEALKALAEKSPSAEADFEMARVYHFQKKSSEARLALMSAIAKDAAFPRAHYELGKMAYEDGRSTDAVSEFEAEIKAHPDDAQTRSALAGLYADVARPGDAISLYEEIVAKNPADTDALVSLDGLYTGQGDAKKSGEVYKKILALNPTGADLVYYRVGVAISKRQDLGESDRSRAMAAFQKAAELNPKNGSAQRELGYALVGLGKLQEAKPHFKAYLELEPAAKDAATIRPFL